MYGLRIVRSSALRTVRLQAGVRPFSTTFVVRADGTGKSHATDPDNASYVPKAAQEILPKSVEDDVPNKIHDTGSSGSKSHATGPSMVPEGIQELAPEALEKALPESIHPTDPPAKKK